MPFISVIPETDTFSLNIVQATQRLDAVEEDPEISHAFKIPRGT
jgi:hypothetical protein